MLNKVEITEVCPRDGFQNVKEFIPTDKKIEIAKKLMDAGFKEMEVVSFVSPKWIPQMADAAEVVEELDKYRKEKGLDVKFIGLAPNAKGVSNAVKSKVDGIVCPISVTEKHNLSNVNRTREQSFKDMEEMINTYEDLDVTVGLACTFISPFPNDPVSIDDIKRMSERAYKIGAKKVVLADTVGTASPLVVDDILSKLKGEYDFNKVSLHLHDTAGFALMNAMIGVKHGFIKYESAAGGLGGCPFAPGAAGNVATEDLLNLFKQMNIETNIDFDTVLNAVDKIKDYVEADIVSHMYPYCRNQR